MIKNWFKKSKVELPDMEEIEISPKIEIPEKTRRELYEGAVREVHKARVRELIQREIFQLGTSPLNIKQSREVIDKYGHNVSPIIATSIRKNYPAVHLERKMGNKDEFRVVQGPNIHTLVDTLTNLYIKEELNATDK